MPEMDGMEATRKLRELGYEHPILALTANAVAGQKDIFLASGFNGYISKPIDIRQLNDSLNKFIRNKERSRQWAEDSATSAEPASYTYIEDIERETYIEGGTFMSQTINIPGVEVETGLALYGEDQDIYISVLRSFLPNILSIIEKLHNVSEELLPDYTINVHGLKSICAGIGAEKVRAAAYDLEMKGKSGDLSGVLAGNESLLKEAIILASAVRDWLEEHENNNPKQKLARPDKELLIRMRKSCETYDVKSIDDIIDKLESAEYETDASLITWLREKIDASDFSSVVSRLLEYEEESK